MEYRSNYLGIHARVYREIAAGKREGWSSPEETAGMVDQVDWAMQALHRPLGGMVLELGCGDGCLTEVLAGRPGVKLTGIDIVAEAIELASERLSKSGHQAWLYAMDVTSLTFPNGSFDLVIDSHCLHCIVPPDRAAFLREAYRVLKPGGALVVITMCGDPAYMEAGEFDPETRCHVVDGIAGRYYGTPEGIIAEIAEAGFTPRAQRIWPARHDQENDDLVVAAVRSAKKLGLMKTDHTEEQEKAV